jgi:uncharacterized membrane protein
VCSSDLFFSYTLPLGQRAAKYRTTLTYDHEAINVFVVKDGIRISNHDLASTGEVKETGIHFEGYAARNLKAGQEMVFDVKKTSARSLSYLWLFVGAMGALIFLAFRSFSLRRSQSIYRTTIGQHGYTRESLTEAIARLDERFAAGEIGKREYEKEKNRLNKRLSEIRENETSPQNRTG